MTVVNVYPASNDGCMWDELAELSHKLLTHIWKELGCCGNSDSATTGDDCGSGREANER